MGKIIINRVYEWSCVLPQINVPMGTMSGNEHMRAM